MFETNAVLIFIFVAVICVGAVGTAYQLYKMVLIDADSRGLKHPKFWGIFCVSGNNSGGLIMYLLGRRKYPVINISDSGRRKMEYCKKAAGVGLIFMVCGAIGFIICGVFM